VGSYHRHLISEMQAGGVTTHRCRQKVLIKDDLVQAGIDGSSASAVWSLRASRDITRGKVIEGVIGEKLFGLHSGDKGSINRNKGGLFGIFGESHLAVRYLIILMLRSPSSERPSQS
jgi:hypothetical protein